MVSTLSNNIYADLFGVTNQDELTHIMSSNTALKFGQTYGEVIIPFLSSNRSATTSMIGQIYGRVQKYDLHDWVDLLIGPEIQLP